MLRLRNVDELDGAVPGVSASGKSTSAEEIEETAFEIGPESLRRPSVRVVAVRLNALSSKVDAVTPEDGEEYESELVYVSSSVLLLFDHAFVSEIRETERIDDASLTHQNGEYDYQSLFGFFANFFWSHGTLLCAVRVGYDGFGGAVGDFCLADWELPHHVVCCVCVRSDGMLFWGDVERADDAVWMVGIRCWCVCEKD